MLNFGRVNPQRLRNLSSKVGSLGSSCPVPGVRLGEDSFGFDDSLRFLINRLVFWTCFFCFQNLFVFCFCWKYYG